MAVDEWQHGVKVLLRHRLYGGRLTGPRPSAPEPLDRHHLTVDGGRYHFLADAPFEKPLQDADPLVERRPGNTGLNHGLLDRLQARRVEGRRRGAAVKRAERP